MADAPVPTALMTPEQLLAAAKAKIEAFKISSSAGYDEAIAKTKGYAEDTSVGNNQSFIDYFNMLNDNAANLGINFADGDLGADYLANREYLSEAADGALATDLAYYEKMRILQQDLYNQMLIQLAQTQLAPAASVGGGSSGGGGRSGGGGGSSNSGAFDSNTGERLGTSDFKRTTTETTDFFNPGYINDEGVLTPRQLALKTRYLTIANTGGAGEATSQMQQDIEDAELFRYIHDTYGPEDVDSLTRSELETYARGEKISDDLNDLYALVEYGNRYNPNFGPTVTRQQVKEAATWDANNIKDVPDPVPAELAAQAASQVWNDITGNKLIRSQPSLESLLTGNISEPVAREQGTFVDAIMDRLNPAKSPAAPDTRPGQYISNGGSPIFVPEVAKTYPANTIPRGPEKDPYSDPRDPRYNPQQNQFGTDQSVSGPGPASQNVQEVRDPNIGSYLTVGRTPQQLLAEKAAADRLTAQADRYSVGAPGSKPGGQFEVKLPSQNVQMPELITPKLNDNADLFNSLGQAQRNKAARDAAAKAAREAEAQRLREAAQARAAANNAAYERNRAAAPVRSGKYPTGPVRGLPTPGAGDRDPRPSIPKPPRRTSGVPGNVR